MPNEENNIKPEAVGQSYKEAGQGVGTIIDEGVKAVKQAVSGDEKDKNKQ